MAAAFRVGTPAHGRIEPIVSLRNVRKEFPVGSESFAVLSDINLDIQQGEFFVLVGPSGSGKSTLLRIISGLEKEYEGSIVFGQGISRADISFVFQQFALLPWLTVSQNVGLNVLALNISASQAQSMIDKELVLLGLEKFAHSFPRELSGGMRQRVGIARALVRNPKIIFMDEPFSELDSFTAQELRNELLRIWQERKPTIVLVTHIVPEAIELASRIAVLTDRPGRIEKIVANPLPRPRKLRSPASWQLEDELYALIKP